MLEVIHRFRETTHVVQGADGRLGLGQGGATGESVSLDGCLPLVATLGPIYPEWLGDRSFCETHGTRFPYVTGAMANGIATTRLVIAMAQAGMLGFFGAAGLSLDRVGKAIDEMESALGQEGPPWGSNLIHSPNEPRLEAGAVDLYLARGVRRVSASAFMSLTPNVVRYSARGLFRDASGHIQRRNHVFAKVSRPEVARQFMAPAPNDMLERLVREGQLTVAEAELARQVAVAEDITVEADSGGHTDNRPLTVILPAILHDRDRLAAQHGLSRPVRVGAAGGLGTPQSIAGAFALGAAYVLTGSVNQGAVESGVCDEARRLLAQAQPEDVIMAASADMFELGVKVQVLKRGTMFGVRANRLYEIYRRYPSLEELPADVKTWVETQVFKARCDEVWERTRQFWAQREPRELEKASSDPSYRMALCFRWYIGLSSRWAIVGDPERRMDYQLWCGPAMGGFNDWVRGSFLEKPENRQAAQIALNLLEGAAVVTRAQQLRTCGVPVPAASFHFTPRQLC